MKIAILQIAFAIAHKRIYRQDCSYSYNLFLYRYTEKGQVLQHLPLFDYVILHYLVLPLSSLSLPSKRQINMKINS